MPLVVQDRIAYIYRLIDPFVGCVRYVGKTVNPNQRYAAHISRSKKTHVGKWIHQLIAAGAKPIMEIIETCPWAESGAAEQRWIKHYRDAGAALTNLTDGGEGVVGIVYSDQSRQKMSLSHKGKVLPQAQKEKISQSLLGRPGHSVSDAVRKEISAKLLGVPLAEETKRKMSIARTGKKQSEAAKQKLRAAHLGKLLSAEHKRKLSEAKRRMWLERRGY